MLLIRLFYVGALFEKALEAKVLDQIRRGELRAARVQRLENLLRVFVDGEIDDHYLQEFPHDCFDGCSPRAHGILSIQRKPLPRLLAEEAMRFDHTLAAVPQ